MASVQWLFAVSFVISIGAATYLDNYPRGTFYFILAACLLAYALDKLAAVKGRRRISENRLHILSLAGGWPGALIAQRVFNHKTRKRPFRIVFWITVLVNCGIVGWTFTGSAEALLAKGVAEIAGYAAPLGR